ncbi:hypothetical protein ACFV5N_07010 [Streptomyces sp. NPDC059853]|uniref:hypothetical protein n=1 Tax=Streptomyces sp. NPDC059853 TaxID=3346973 RepID=UPI003655564C
MTAVMAPAALLAASPAFATEGERPAGAPETVQEDGTAGDTTEPDTADGTEHDADDTGPDTTTPDPDGTGTAETEPVGTTDEHEIVGGISGPGGGEDSDDDAGEDEDTDEEDTDDDSGEDDSGEGDDDSGGLPDPDAECTDYAWDVEAIGTELIGLPSEVVAGQWTEFTYRITNGFDQPVEELYAFAEVYAWDNENFDDIAIDLQWFVDGAWENIEDAWGYFGVTDVLAPGEYADARLRLKAAADAPAGTGYALSTGVYVSPDGVCQEGELNTFYFDIVPAGTTPDDTPAPGTKEPVNKPAPQGEFEKLPVTGELAATGASSVLPLFTLAGAAAVALGAGTMVAVRRRSGATTA